MMSLEWQRADLAENVRQLSEFRAFRRIFAVPFGRTQDWSDETLRFAKDLDLDVVLADGGINVRPAPAYRRISCDSRVVAPLVYAAQAGAVV